MKSDIDNLMQSRNLDVLLIMGAGQNNPAMVYLTGGAHLTSAYLIKKRGESAVLFHRSMERDGALETGLETKIIESYYQKDLYKKNRDDPLRGQVALLQCLLNDLNINSGRIALYGQYEAGQVYAIFSALQSEMPGLTLVGELNSSVLLSAMSTKDQTEIERIMKMGKITTEVVTNVSDYLKNCKVNKELLLKTDGTPLTIGDMRKQINQWLLERNAENPMGTIFSIGRDAGVPHNVGNDSDYLRMGRTIIFDIFPCEAGGGYFYDMTRTWCLGYAPDEVYEIYEDVQNVYHQVVNSLKAEMPFKDYQDMTCDLFEQKGHPTIRQDPQIQSGYVHSVGHGLGLHVHENPFSRSTSSDQDRLLPGTVFTIEPGLYYPERGLGIRLEDTYMVSPDGQIEVMAECPLDLVLPVG